MGIIKATSASLAGASKDQWKEVFICDGTGGNAYIQKATKRKSDRSGNDGDDNVITDGSIIIVSAGECAIATENGKVIAVYDTPGEHIFRSQKSAGIFTGGLKAYFKDVAKRISYGGDMPCIHRLYYINTRALSFTSFYAHSVPVRIRDKNTAMDVDYLLNCSGRFCIQIEDPKKFYQRAGLDKMRELNCTFPEQIKSELLSSLAPTLAELCNEGIRPSDLPKYSKELCDKICKSLNEKWVNLRGIRIFSILIETFSIEDAETIKNLQMNSMLIRESQSQKVQHKPASEKWTCACGWKNAGKFCEECGKPRP